MRFGDGIVSNMSNRRLEPEFQIYSLKEVIQPHLPVRLPCYDLAPVKGLALDAEAASSTPFSHGLTGGVYKARERIHRGVLTHDY